MKTEVFKEMLIVDKAAAEHDQQVALANYNVATGKIAMAEKYLLEIEKSDNFEEFEKKD